MIRNAIVDRLNIVISGGTGSGKTTLANAIIAEMVETAPEHRLVILEDTAEIQCAAENAVLLHTTDAVDMARLLKSTMRLRPDRIIVGEVRDGAALTLLKAWNTGHPGGVATIHSNTRRRRRLRRLEQLVAEVSQQPMREVIGEAVDLIVSIERTPNGRRVRDILQVEGFRERRATRSKAIQRDREADSMSHRNLLRLAGSRRSSALRLHLVCTNRPWPAGEGACPGKGRCNRSSNPSPARSPALSRWRPWRLPAAC